MKATTAGKSRRIRIAAGDPICVESEDEKDNGGRSEDTAGRTLRGPGVARDDGGDDTVTVYGPRQGEKVNATMNRSADGRLLVTFHNLDMKGKSKFNGDEQAKTQKAEEDDEDLEMDSDSCYTKE